MRSSKSSDRSSLPPASIEFACLQSGSEYACAKMLEKYASWKGIDGATMQIKVGRAVFDFRIHNTFVEYHPVSLKCEFVTDGMRDISSAIHKLPRRDKIEVFKAIATELEAQYAKRRSQVLSAHSVYGEMGFICVHSPEEFIHRVLYKFATIDCGDMHSMKREFNKLRKDFTVLR